MEKRAFGLAELRVSRQEGRGPKVAGYAAMFDSESVDLGGFTERVARGAFAGSLSGDVRALWNHDPMHLLGRTTSRTLRLQEDMRGLAIEFDPPDTQVGRDVVALIERKDVTGMSFAFRTLKDAWAKVSGKWLRTLLDVDLFDVSPVTFPAYPSTEIGLRAAMDATEGLEGLKRAQAEDELAGIRAISRARRLRWYERA